jgi:3-oxoacyl-[acyl-carrier protein] reductase
LPQRDANASSNGSGNRDSGCALVTGAGRGMGAAIAKSLAGVGWPVAVNYNQSADAAAEVASAIEADGGRAVTVQADVSDFEAVDAMFDEVEEKLGPVLVLVNNAGTRSDRVTPGLDVDAWDRVIDVNLNGTFYVMRRALGPMVRARFGRVVNISSISAHRPLPGQSSYAASKAGVEALTQTAATEVAKRGITVNAIAPGLVETDFVGEIEEYARATPSKRPAAPEEIARCVRFLASEDAAYVNGSVLTVDGALTAGLGLLFRQGPPESVHRMVND